MRALDPQAALAGRPAGRQVDSADVIALLREVYAEGIATQDEAEELIAFDHSLAEPTPGWTDFFAATIADHVVRCQTPLGVVDGQKAKWLIGSLGWGGRAATQGGFAALLRIIETAREISPELAAYAIRQVRSAVLAGRRPASAVSLFLQRTIDSATAELVRRIVLGSTGQSQRPVSRAEAEAMFDLHDLTARGANDEDFDDLFFKAIAHHVIAAAGRSVPERRDALARHGDFPHGLAGAFVLGADEKAWLASHIMRDGRPTTAELKLLRFFTDWVGGSDPAVDRSLIRAA